MPATYEPIATTTLSSPTTNISFTSIPASYTDLRVVINYSMASGSTAVLRFNNNTGTTYAYKGLIGSTSVVAYGGTATGIRIPYNTQTNGMAFAMFDVFNYTSSNYKMVLYSVNQPNTSTGETGVGVGAWSVAAAITRVDLFGSTTVNFNTGTQATIYGILKA